MHAVTVRSEYIYNTECDSALQHDLLDTAVDSYVDGVICHHYLPLVNRWRADPVPSSAPYC